MLKIICPNLFDGIDKINRTYEKIKDKKFFKLFSDAGGNLIKFIKSIDDITLSEIVNSLEACSPDNRKCNENDHQNIINVSCIGVLLMIIFEIENRKFCNYAAQMYFEILSTILKEEYKQRTIVVN